jgi:hypothetical protein
MSCAETHFSQLARAGHTSVFIELEDVKRATHQHWRVLRRKNGRETQLRQLDDLQMSPVDGVLRYIFSQGWGTAVRGEFE